MIYDISQTLSTETPVWPGDTPLSQEILASHEAGDPCMVSTLRTTVHIGTHADAPGHFSPSGASIEAVSLEPYLGPCQLIRPKVSPGELITGEMLAFPVKAPRILFATDSYRGNPTGPFTALDPRLIETLHGAGVLLVGLDTPSVDPADSTDYATHLACAEYSMAILEGLVLDQVPEGVYELIALPLRLAGFDASPVRAVLRD